ncbi:hypothetical protein D3C81_766510 [compost metagenome]
MLRYAERGVAFGAQVRLGDFDVVPGVAADQVEALDDLRLGFQFDALRAHFAFLAHVTEGEELGEVFPGQVERSDGVHRVVVVRLVFQADLVLLADGRLQLRTVGGVADGRQERLAVAGVGREAVLEHVDDPGAAGELFVLLRLRDTVVALVAGPVVAPAEHEDPVVDLHLVLQVDASHAELLLVVRSEGGHEGLWLAVDRLEHVERIEGQGYVLLLVELAVVVVETGERRVANGTGIEVGLRLGVDGEQAAVALALVIGAEVDAFGQRGQAKARSDGGVEQREFRAVLAVVAVAQVLADGPDIVEVVLEHVAQRGLLVGHVVVEGVADVGIAIQPALGGGEHSAGGGQGVGEVAGLLLVFGEKGQLGVVAGTEADRRGEVLAAVGDVVGLGIAFAEQAGQAVAPDAFLVQLVAEVEGALLVVEVAGLQLHFVQRRGGRTLAHQVDLAARVGNAIQGRAGAAQHFDALQAVGLRGVPAEEVGQEGAGAVAQHAPGAHLEATDGQLVGDELRAGQLGVDAGGVAQRLGDGLRLLGLDLVAGHHGDGGWRFDQRGVGLGADAGALGDEAVQRGRGAVGLADDAGARQGQRGVVAGAEDDVVAVDLVADRRAFEQAAQGLFGLHASADAAAPDAPDGVLAVDDLQVGLLA